MYKDILVHIPTERPMRAAIDGSISLAASLNAHIDAVAVGYFATSAAYVMEGGAAVAAVIEMERERAVERAEVALAPETLAAAVRTSGAEPPGDPANGKKIYSESRCISCHTLEGKGNGSAPELSKIASSAGRGWLLAFIRDPHAFNPRTRNTS